MRQSAPTVTKRLNRKGIAIRLTASMSLNPRAALTSAMIEPPA